MSKGSTMSKQGVMRTTLAVVVLCALSQAAHAKGPVCRDIPSSSARLACYDLASPPKPEPRAATESNAAKPAYKDPFIEEEARTTAKLKHICRGC